MRFPALVVVLAAVAGGLTLFGCHEQTLSECLEPNGQAYTFGAAWDTTVVFHWPASRMPLRVYAAPVGQMEANVDSAIALWTHAMRCGELRMVRTTDSTEADVIIGTAVSLPPFQSAGPDRGARIVLGDSVGACQGRTDGEIDTTTTPYELVGPMRSYVAPTGADTAAATACYHFTVAHELGHALGILNESPDPNDLMYAVPHRLFATTDDRFTMQTLYHTRATVVPAP